MKICINFAKKYILREVTFDMKNSEAAGGDGINAEVIQYGHLILKLRLWRHGNLSRKAQGRIAIFIGNYCYRYCIKNY